MIEQLSEASGGEKHSKLLAVMSYQELFSDGYLKSYYGKLLAQKGKMYTYG